MVGTSARFHDQEDTARLLDQGGAQGFRDIPRTSQGDLPHALTIAAEDGKPDIAKPVRDMGSGVFEIALPFRGNAFRVVYAVQLGEEIWVVHAFQKKSTQGAETPKREIDLIRARLRQLKEMLG